MKYAISAVPGHEAETFGATEWALQGFPVMTDAALNAAYEVAFVAEFDSHDAAMKAAQEHYQTGF